MNIRKYISIFLWLCGLGFMSVSIYANTIEKPVMVYPLWKIENDIVQLNKKIVDVNNGTLKISVLLDKSVNPPVIVYDILMLTITDNSPEAEALKTMDLKIIEDQQLESMCSLPQTNELIKVGINFRFSYKDKNSNELNVMSIDLGKCPR